VSSRYIFKPIFHSFWLTHTLVNLPLQGPLRVYLCLACPLPSIAIGLPCTTTLVHHHLSYSPACNSVTMHHLVLYRTTLHLYITIPHLVVTEPITFHSLNTSNPTYLNIPGYRSTPLLIHSTPYLSLYYSFSLSPALDSVNMYSPPSSLSMTRSANTCLQDGRSTPTHTPLGNIQVYGLVRSSY